METAWQKKALQSKKQYKKILEKGNKNTLLKKLPRLHEEAFEKIDCLSCAACCKNYSPRFKAPDIKRISRYLRMKESAFIATYLQTDEDGDYVLQTEPCSFLDSDNKCSIYDVRPSDCMRFPYTNEDVFFKRKNITLKNSEFCPIVFHVLEALKNEAL